MKFSQYELLKKIWINEHPNATYKQYELAIAEVARKCGV